MKIWLVLLSVAIVSVSCTTMKVRDRDPSSDDDFFSEKTKYKHYLNHIPVDQRAVQVLDAAMFNNLKVSCPRFGEVPPVDRFSMLTLKLNRPFNFLQVPNTDGGIGFMGDGNQMKEFFCLMIAMGETEKAAGLDKTDRSQFIFQLAQMPNTNFKIMEIMVGTWTGKRTSLAAAKTIIHHREFDVFTAKEMLGSLYKSNNDRQEKILILQELLEQPAYKEKSFELSHIFLRENAGLVTSQERVDLTRIFLDQKNSFDKDELLRFVLRNPDQDINYLPIYQKFIAGAAIEDQFDILAGMLDKRIPLGNPDELILALWGQAKASTIQDSIASYVVADISSANKFKHETHIKIITERLAKPSNSGNFIRAVLLQIFNTEKFTATERLSIMKAISKNELADLEPVRLYLNGLTVIEKEGSTTGAEFSESAIKAAKHFENEVEVVRIFSKFVLGISDLKYKYALVQQTVPMFSFDDAFYADLLREVQYGDQNLKYLIIEKILARPKLSDDVLGYIVDATKKTFQISEIDKKILNLVVKHPSVTAALADVAKKKMSTAVEYVTDPGGH